MVYLQRWHAWCHMNLLPSRRVLCTPYNHAPCHFMQSHIRKVYACLAVICHLHFWQNDRDLLRATAVTRGWNGYRNKSQHRKSTLVKRKFSRSSCRDSNPRPFNHESGALAAELSPPLHIIYIYTCLLRFNHWHNLCTKKGHFTGVYVGARPVLLKTVHVDLTCAMLAPFPQEQTNKQKLPNKGKNSVG